MYQLDDEIYVSEIDTRDSIVQNQLDTTNTGNAMVASSANGDELYYLKQQNGQMQLIKSLQVVPTKGFAVPGL